MSHDAERPAGGSQQEKLLPPVFDPDPELIDDGEGNRLERWLMRRHARKSRQEALERAKHERGRRIRIDP